MANDQFTDQANLTTLSTVPPAGEQELALRNKALDTSAFTIFKNAIPATDAWKFLEQKSIPTDPNFKAEDHFKELDKVGIQSGQWPDFMGTRSQDEFNVPLRNTHCFSS